MQVMRHDESVSWPSESSEWLSSYLEYLEIAGKKVQESSGCPDQTPLAFLAISCLVHRLTVRSV